MYDDRAAQSGNGVDRLIFLSDGIFAIAMTLLILDLPVPQIPRATDADLLGAVVELLPNAAAFIISFTLVGFNWMNHHRMLRYLVRYDQRLIVLNLLFLMLICVMPFATGTLSRYGYLATATIAYGAIMCLMAVASTAIRLHLSAANLLDPPADKALARDSVANAFTITAVFLISMPIALWRPDAAKLFWLMLIPTRAIAIRYPWRRARTA